MLTGKQRSYLKSLAHNIKPTTQLGKDGISESFLDQLSVLLDQHELVKISVLDNSSETAENAAIEVCKALNAEFVQAIGKKFTIYRQSRLDPMLEIPGADNTRVKINKQRKASVAKKVETVTKKGGKKSKPLKGKRSAAKARKAEEEKTIAPVFSFFNKNRSNSIPKREGKYSDSLETKSSDEVKATVEPKAKGSLKFSSMTKNFGASKTLHASKRIGETKSEEAPKKFGASKSTDAPKKYGASSKADGSKKYGATKSSEGGRSSDTAKDSRTPKESRTSKASGTTKSYSPIKASSSSKSSSASKAPRSFKSNKRGQ